MTNDELLRSTPLQVELIPEDHQQIERERREAMKVRRTRKPQHRR